MRKHVATICLYKVCVNETAGKASASSGKNFGGLSGLFQIHQLSFRTNASGKMASALPLVDLSGL